MFIPIYVHVTRNCTHIHMKPQVIVRCALYPISVRCRVQGIFAVYNGSNKNVIAIYSDFSSVWANILVIAKLICEVSIGWVVILSLNFHLLCVKITAVYRIDRSVFTLVSV